MLQFQLYFHHGLMVTPLTACCLTGCVLLGVLRGDTLLVCCCGDDPLTACCLTDYRVVIDWLSGVVVRMCGKDDSLRVLLHLLATRDRLSGYSRTISSENGQQTSVMRMACTRNVNSCSQMLRLRSAVSTNNC